VGCSVISAGPGEVAFPGPASHTNTYPNPEKEVSGVFHAISQKVGGHV
jgi:hypothetical protein